MPLTENDVKRIAELSRISISDSEVISMQEKLNNIFTLIEKMQAVNTDHVEPMAHPQNISLRLRQDIVTESNHRDEFLSLAPQTQDGLFLVPKVIETE